MPADGRRGNACPRCGAPRAETLFEGRDWEFGNPGVFFVVRCGACGWTWTEPPATAAALAALYPPADYYAYRDDVYALTGFREAVVRRLKGYPPAGRADGVAKFLVAVARPWLNRRYYNVPAWERGGRLLDVGAGAGAFVALAAGLGWEARGLEFNAEAAARGRALGMEIATADAAALKNGELPGPFDFIRVHHTLEHTNEPRAALAALAPRAAPGARLLVAVPNARGLFARLFGRYWYHWALPFHRVHFDARLLKTLVRDTGWRPTRTFYVSSPAGLIRSLKPLLGRCGEKAPYRVSPWERLLVKAIRPAVFLLDILGMGDNLIVESRRAPAP